MDKVSPKVRRKNMQAIRSKNTKPELLFRKALWKEGIRGYRLHNKNIPGKPDLIFIGRKIAIFIDGCFWHGCPKCYVQPKTRTEFWRNKVEYNKKRDSKNTATLVSKGWFVLRIWEHEIYQNINDCVLKVKQQIVKKDTHLSI